MVRKGWLCMGGGMMCRFLFIFIFIIKIINIYMS